MDKLYNFLTAKGQLVAFGLGLVIILLFYLFAGLGVEEFNMLAKEDQGTTTIFNFGLAATVLLVLLCFAAMLIFGVYQMATNPQGAKKGLIGLGGLAVIFLIFYFTADTSAAGSLGETLSEFGISEKVHQYVSAAIATTGVLGLIAIVSLVFTEVKNFFK